MALLHVSIHDDRGRRVPLVSYELPLGKDSRAARLRAAAAVPRESPTRGEVVRSLIAGFFILPAMLGAALAPAYVAFNWSWPWWGQLLAVALVIVLPGAIIFVFARRLGARRIACVYRHAGLCASCGYDLADTTPQADGCRLCPECGASWRYRVHRAP